MRPQHTHVCINRVDHTHKVNSNGDVYVELSKMPGWIESDYYQGEEGKEKRAKAEAEAEADEGMESS